MNIKKEIMVDCNFYVGDKNCFASASEVSVPEIKPKKIEMSSMASVGTLKLPTGKIEALETKVKITGFSAEVFAEVADMFKSVEIAVYGDLVTFDGDEAIAHKPAKLFMTCSASSFKALGDKKEHDNIEQEITLDVSAFKLEVNGVNLYEVDIPNNILKVKGKDLRKDINRNLGI